MRGGSLVTELRRWVWRRGEDHHLASLCVLCARTRARTRKRTDARTHTSLADTEQVLQIFGYIAVIAHVGTGAAAGFIASSKGRSPYVPALKVGRGGSA